VDAFPTSSQHLEEDGWLLMPAEGGVVDHTFKVTGSFSNLPPGASIWVLVQPHDAPQYHPQSGPAIELSGGQWSTIAYAGESPFKNIGGQFEVTVVVAKLSANNRAHAVALAVQRGLISLDDLKPAKTASK